MASLAGRSLVRRSDAHRRAGTAAKGDGDAVHAGTVVQDGSVLFTASAVGSQTTLARIIRMVRQAQSSKPEIGQLADKISAVFVPAVVAIALFSAAIWYFLARRRKLSIPW